MRHTEQWQCRRRGPSLWLDVSLTAMMWEGADCPMGLVQRSVRDPISFPTASPVQGKHLVFLYLRVRSVYQLNKANAS